MTQLTERLDRFDDRLRSLETELAELRRLARAEEHAPQKQAPAQAPEPPLWEMFEPAEIPATVIPREQPARSGPVPGTVPGTRPVRRSRTALRGPDAPPAIARAFSCLAVGGLILVAGFFYQRLAGGRPEARA